MEGIVFMIKRFVVGITIMSVLVILYCIVDNRYALIKVLDRTTQEYIYEPQITMFPDIPWKDSQVQVLQVPIFINH